MSEKLSESPLKNRRLRWAEKLELFVDKDGYVYAPDLILTHALALEARLSKMEQHDPNWLDDRRTDLIELYEGVRGNFDNTEYQQGKKDGLRIALALLGFNAPPSVEALAGGNEKAGCDPYQEEGKDPWDRTGGISPLEQERAMNEKEDTKTAAQAFRDLNDALIDFIAPIVSFLTTLLVLLDRLIKKAIEAGKDKDV